MVSQPKKGFELAPNLLVYAVPVAYGVWESWLEQNGVPLESAPGKPRLFRGSTCFQAQCKAADWLRACKPGLDKSRG